MKILRMRAHRRSTLLVAVLAAVTSTALAQSKKKPPAKAPAKAPAKPPDKSPTPAKGDEGEIEMNPDDSAPKKGGSGSDVNPDEIDMGEAEKPGDLKTDLNTATTET